MIDFDELADDIAALALNSDVTNESGETRSVREVVGRYLRPVEIELNRLREQAKKMEATTISTLRCDIERLKSYTAAYNTLLAERVEIECLRGLAIRAWNSFRSGLTAGGGCDCGLTDADILELVRLANEHPPA